MELFTEEERDQYRSNMHQTKDKHEFKRLCSLLSYDFGISVSTIASVLQLSESVVFCYISDFKKHHKAKHSAQGGSNSKLTDAQTQGLKSHLKEKTYLYVKDIVSYVSVNYNIRYSISGMYC